MDGLMLLAEARRAGLIVTRDHDRLVIEGPTEAEALARRLLANKSSVLIALDLDSSWSEWTELRDGRIWRVIQRNGVEIWPWDDCIAPQRTRQNQQFSADDAIVAMSAPLRFTSSQ